MSIEQIAQEADNELCVEGIDIEANEFPAEFLRRCLSKLAEQAEEPVAWMCWLDGDTEMNSSDAAITRCEPTAYKNRAKLYTEAQLIAAQQKVAEACAKTCDKRESVEKQKAIECRSKKDIACAQMYSQNAGQAMLMAQDIRNGEWREYL